MQNYRELLNSMRILLGSRDLINVVEHGRGATVKVLDAFLRGGNHEVLLCFSSVREFASPLSIGRSFLDMRPLLKSLGQFPHTYLEAVA